MQLESLKRVFFSKMLRQQATAQLVRIWNAKLLIGGQTTKNVPIKTSLRFVVRIWRTRLVVWTTPFYLVKGKAEHRIYEPQAIQAS